MKSSSILLTLFLLMSVRLSSQTVLPLYPGEIPNSLPGKDEETVEKDKNGIVITSKISRPTLTVFLPAKEVATGAAVIICPGGGYYVNASSHEGSDVAQVFAKAGIAAIVLKYRIPDDRTMKLKEIGPLQDAQQAIVTVRTRAKEWGLDPNRVGIMGFSAGGHLASTAGTHYRDRVAPLAGTTNLRPDFMLLIYPVINMNDTIAHKGSAEALLGKNATTEKLQAYSNETLVDANTPPTFLVHSSDDDVVPVQNSLRLYEALVKHKIAAELHVYQQGGHGYGMNLPNTSEHWMDAAINWMKLNGWLKKS